MHIPVPRPFTARTGALGEKRKNHSDQHSLLQFHSAACRSPIGLLRMVGGQQAKVSVPEHSVNENWNPTTVSLSDGQPQL